MKGCAHDLAAFDLPSRTEGRHIVALAGNPNVGKSTLFNALTGMRQHTGNWPGKTVTRASGEFTVNGREYLMVDLPGTYSLLTLSADERVARDFILFAEPDITLVVCDATALERNLNLALQVMEITTKVIVCVNLLDEAERKGIRVDLAKLSALLGVPVVGMTARSKRGVQQLMETLDAVVTGETVPAPKRVSYASEVETAAAALAPELSALMSGVAIDGRWLAIRLLEGDDSVFDSLRQYTGIDLNRSLLAKEANGCVTA